MTVQHTNVRPMTAAQMKEYAASLRKLANVEAQAGTRDPVAAAEFVAWLAARYEADHGQDRSRQETAPGSAEEAG